MPVVCRLQSPDALSIKTIGSPCGRRTHGRSGTRGAGQLFAPERPRAIDREPPYVVVDGGSGIAFLLQSTGGLAVVRRSIPVLPSEALPEHFAQVGKWPARGMRNSESCGRSARSDEHPAHGCLSKNLPHRAAIPFDGGKP